MEKPSAWLTPLIIIIRNNNFRNWRAYYISKKCYKVRVLIFVLHSNKSKCIWESVISFTFARIFYSLNLNRLAQSKNSRKGLLTSTIYEDDRPYVRWGVTSRISHSAVTCAVSCWANRCVYTCLSWHPVTAIHHERLSGAFNEENIVDYP